MLDGAKQKEHAVAAVRCVALLAVAVCHRFDGTSLALDLWLAAGAAYALLTTFHPARWQKARVVSASVLLDVAYITGLIALSGHTDYMLLYYLPVMLASVRLHFLNAVRAALLATFLLATVVLLHGDGLSSSHSPLVQVYIFAGSAVVLTLVFYSIRQSANRQQEVADRLEAALQRLAAMHEVARSAHGPDGLQQLAHTTAALATRLVGADYGYLALADPAGTLSVHAVHMEQRPASHLAFDAQVANHCVVQQAPVLKHVHWQEREEYTVAAIPLVGEGQPIGALQVIRRSNRSFRSREIELLSALCAEAATTIAAARLRDKVYALAAVDQVTGLYNAEEFKRLVALTVRDAGNQPMALVAFDLDGSSDTASRYGTKALDEQLTVFADVVRRSVRDYDVAGRLGEDEVGVLLVNCTADGARAAASRLRQAFSHRTFHFDDAGPEITATVCAGIAAVQPGEAPEDPLALLSRAASALTEAKAAGANQIRWWEHGAPAPFPSQLSWLLQSGQGDSSWK